MESFYFSFFSLPLQKEAREKDLMRAEGMISQALQKHNGI